MRREQENEARVGASMNQPRWLTVVIWGSFAALALGALVTWYALSNNSNLTPKQLDDELRLGFWLIIGSAIVMVGSVLANTGYLIIFQREEWLRRWRAQPKMPVWFWVLYVAVFAGFFALSQYSRRHEEFRAISSMTFGLAYCFMGLMLYYRQPEKKRWHSLVWAMFFLFGVWQIYDGWDSIGTSDLRYCLGQTYYQRVPVESVGCEIVKAIPTPRYFYFDTKKCPIRDYTGCQADYPWSFSSYNQRKAAGISTD
jgi:hypothetical protein